MSNISEKYRRSLDDSPPLRPVRGEGYIVQVWGRGAVRYLESDKAITLFSDFVRRTEEAYRGSLLSEWFNRLNGNYCLAVYIEDPLRWDNEEPSIPPERAAIICQRIEGALIRRTPCHRIDRGPNRQGHGIGKN